MDSIELMSVSRRNSRGVGGGREEGGYFYLNNHVLQVERKMGWM